MSDEINSSENLAKVLEQCAERARAYMDFADNLRERLDIQEKELAALRLYQKQLGAESIQTKGHLSIARAAADEANKRAAELRQQVENLIKINAELKANPPSIACPNNTQFGQIDKRPTADQLQNAILPRLLEACDEEDGLTVAIRNAIVDALKLCGQVKQ